MKDLGILSRPFFILLLLNIINDEKDDTVKK